MPAEPDILTDIHRFWFGPLAGPDDYPLAEAPKWFATSSVFDDDIRRRYGAVLSLIAATEWPLDTLSREAAIGLVVALDQFPRNIFRRDARAFAFDARARAVARTLVEDGVERFYPVERAFLYLPFEHSEDPADQALCVALFETLAADAPEAQKQLFADNLVFAKKHKALIDRFGRFPHRNADLGRQSTLEEIAFLQAGGRGY